MQKKTFNEKMNTKSISAKFANTSNGKSIVLSPAEFDAVMKMIPERKLITVTEIKAYLAKKHNVDYIDGMATGICINQVANASKEREKLGSTDLTPYWRTLKAKGELNERYPGGIEAQKMQLEAEGHTVVQRGKRFFVEGYEDKLIEL